MLAYIVQRLLQSIIILFLVTLVSFIITMVLPGDPVLALLGASGASEEYIQAKRAELGVDKPIYVKYFLWLKGMLTGDLGKSLRTGHRATTMILERLPVTLQLLSFSILLGLLIAFPWGILSSLYPQTWIDSLGTLFTTSGVAIPRFWSGMMLILLFSIWFRLLPPAGYVSPAENFGASILHLILPSIALGSALAAETMRQLRSGLLEVFGAEYITTARAKGLTERRIIIKHAMRNALIPVVTLLGLRIGRLVGGAVIVEVVFSLPGIGLLAMNSIASRDFPVVQTVVLLIAASIVLVNILIDISYAFLDPRIRYD